MGGFERTIGYAVTLRHASKRALSEGGEVMSIGSEIRVIRGLYCVLDWSR